MRRSSPEQEDGLIITVAQIGVAFVKATQLLEKTTIPVTPAGLRWDRDFCLLEENGQAVSPANHSQFIPLRFDYDEASDRLILSMPDGEVIEGAAAGSGRPCELAVFGGRTVPLREVEGPWAERLSAFAGRPIGLFRCEKAGGGIDILPITFVTTGSIRRLSRELATDVDPARFRAGFVFDNLVEHEEDAWNGKLLRVGEVLLRVRSPVPRCLITGFDARTGERGLNVMQGLVRYREKGGLPPEFKVDLSLPTFASYAEVVTPGTVKVGDPVALAE